MAPDRRAVLMEIGLLVIVVSTEGLLQLRSVMLRRWMRTVMDHSMNDVTVRTDKLKDVDHLRMLVLVIIENRPVLTENLSHCVKEQYILVVRFAMV